MDELDVSDFRHGGANITGFRLVNPDFSRTKEAQKEWWKFGSHYWKGAVPGQKIPVRDYNGRPALASSALIIRRLQSQWLS